MAADTQNPIDDHPWPKKSDRLFAERPQAKPSRATGSIALDQVLESMYPEPDYRYRAGYYEAAQVLASELAECGHSDLYFPMLYCYRHFLELSVKSLIHVYARLQDAKVRISLHREHNLAKLWNEAKRLIQQAEPNARKDDETLRNVGRCINELNQVDKNAQLFRYATDNWGDTATTSLPRLELEQLATTMENLHAFFDGCRTQAEVWQEWKEEMADHYRADCEY